MTFEGTFLQTISDIVGTFGGLVGLALAEVLDDFDIEMSKLFCCTAEEAPKWKSCSWHGEPGTCFDNHCDTGHQVQLAESAYGQGESCFPRLERSRAFCCDPSDGGSPFLPVPLEYLFPHPPPKDTADTEFDLQIDPTWGTGSDKGDDDPDVSPIAFHVFVT
jgi:chitinase